MCIASILIYFQVWYKSPQVDSKIFELHSILLGHEAEIWAVKFSPDGGTLASASVDRSVKVWDLTSAKAILDLKHPEGVTNLAYSRNGRLLVTTSYDGKIRLWDLPEGRQTKEFIGHQGAVWSVDFSPDGKILASGGEDATVRLWDIRSGQLLRTLTGHKLNIWDVKFSRDGFSLASGSFDKTIRIWMISNGNLITELSGHSEAIVALAFSKNGQVLASASDDSSLKLWDTRNWSVLRTIVVPEHFQAVDFSPDDKMLVAGGRDKPIIGEFLQNIFGDSHHNKGVSMRLWDVESGRLLQTFSQNANDVNDVMFHAGGNWIANTSSDKTLELWRLSEKK